MKLGETEKSPEIKEQKSDSVQSNKKKKQCEGNDFRCSLCQHNQPGEAFYLLEMLVCPCGFTLKVKLKHFQTIKTLFINYFILYFGNWMQG